jgi:hypothetical protein
MGPREDELVHLIEILARDYNVQGGGLPFVKIRLGDLTQRFKFYWK